MKILKSIVLLSFALFAFNSMQAQIAFGAKAGVNMSTTYGTAEEFNGETIESIGLRPGFQAGVTLGIGITDAFKIQGELNFENRNGLKKINLTSTAPTPLGDLIVETDAELKNSFNYFNIPVLAIFGSGSLKFYAGPNFAYLLSAKTKQTTTTDITLPDGLPENTPGLPQSGTIENEVDFKNDAPYDEDGSFINEFDLGINVGAMFHLTEKAHIDFRINHGLTDSTNNDYDTSLLSDEKREDADRNVSIQLGIGISF